MTKKDELVALLLQCLDVVRDLVAIAECDSTANPQDFRDTEADINNTINRLQSVPMPISRD